MTDNKKVYLDHSATSYPKPEAVYQAVDNFARQTGVGGGRGNYVETNRVAKMVAETRQLLGELLNCDSQDIVLTSGATESMNLVLRGCLKAGDHAIISPFEHNCVLRPLEFLVEREGVEVSVLPGLLEEGFDPEALKKLLRPETKICVLNHIANSFGTVQRVCEAGKILAKREGLFFVVDAAQSLGTHEVDAKKLQADAICFSGHKGTLGPTGTGGFYIHPRMVEAVEPLVFGGTGRNGGTKMFSRELPHKYEVGTQNSWGIVGLRQGLKEVIKTGVRKIANHINGLTTRASAGLKEIDGVELFLPSKENHHGIVAFRLESLPPVDTAILLDKFFSIKVRSGLQCSPAAHKLLGTYPEGTVRASFGLANSAEDVEVFIRAVKSLVEDSS